MKGSGLTGGRRRAALAVASGSCLALTACAAAATGDTPGQVRRASIPPATLKFCKQVATAMTALDSSSVTQYMSLTQAHKLVDQLMQRGVASFTTLAGKAPMHMKPTVLGVVADFRAYQKTTDKASSVQQILAIVSKGTPGQEPAYGRLLTYTSDNC